MVTDRMSIKEACSYLGMTEQTLRIALQLEKFGFGRAIKTSGRYTYWISRNKFFEETGITPKGAIK